MKAIIFVPIVLMVITASSCNAEVKIYAIGTPFTDIDDPRTGRKYRDACAVTVTVVNHGNTEVTLPSKELGPLLIPRAGKTIFEFGYSPGKFRSENGDHPLIPSRESFAPVTLRPGECLMMDPYPFFFQHAEVKETKILFVLDTTGFLADRLGFSGLRAEAEMIVLEHNRPFPPELGGPKRKPKPK